jgi:hypothetical protein
MTTLVKAATIESSLYNSLATLTGTQTLVNKTLKVTKEAVTVTNTAAAGSLNFDVATQAIMVYNTATSNFNIAVRGDANTNLNSVLAVGESIGICLIVPNGNVPYYLTAISIDNVAQNPIFQSGVVFFAGNMNSTDMYNLFIIKTGTANATTGLYQIYASQTKFA